MILNEIPYSSLEVEERTALRPEPHGRPETGSTPDICRELGEIPASTLYHSRHRLLEAVGEGFAWRAYQRLRCGADQEPGGLLPVRVYAGKRFQADVASSHAERSRVVFGQPRHRPPVNALVDVDHQLVGALDGRGDEGREPSFHQFFSMWLAISTAVPAPLGLPAAKKSSNSGPFLEFVRTRRGSATL